MEYPGNGLNAPGGVCRVYYSKTACANPHFKKKGGEKKEVRELYKDYGLLAEYPPEIQSMRAVLDVKKFVKTAVRQILSERDIPWATEFTASFIDWVVDSIGRPLTQSETATMIFLSFDVYDIIVKEVVRVERKRAKHA